MTLVATLVLLVVSGVSLWSLVRAPGRQAAEQFAGIWNTTPWGKQFFFDFFGLATMLALWMLSDAAERGTWVLAIACAAAMPVFGAMSAALYWLLR
jgi:hypothetical protein